LPYFIPVFLSLSPAIRTSSANGCYAILLTLYCYYYRSFAYILFVKQQEQVNCGNYLISVYVTKIDTYAMTYKNGCSYLAGLKQTQSHRGFDKLCCIMRAYLSHEPVTVEFYGPLTARQPLGYLFIGLA
jgi:hypothetical protein